MNEKFAHTPGKLVVSSIGVGFEIESEAGEVIAQAQQVISKDRIQGLAIRKENARRLAACWNVCSGLPTDHLESFMGAIGMQGGFVGLWSNYCDMKEQRADLLEALKDATDALAGGLWDFGPGQDEHDKCNEVIAQCRAFLVKATGKTSEAA